MRVRARGVDGRERTGGENQDDGGRRGGDLSEWDRATHDAVWCVKPKSRHSLTHPSASTYRRPSLVSMSQSSPPTPYSQPSPTQVANDRAAARAREEIARRTSLGEFGHPPDLDLRDRAWMQIFEQEVLTRQPKSYYHQVTAVWNDRGFYNDSNKVLYSGQTREQVTIPKGVKVLVLKNNPQQGTRQPNANIVYVTIGDETE